MNRVAVQSSNVRSVGYDAAAQCLEVEFHPDRRGRCAVWQYTNVTPEMHEGMMAPGVSIGRFLHESVKAHPAVVAVDVTPEFMR